MLSVNVTNINYVMIVSHSYLLVGIILLIVIANAGEKACTRKALEMTNTILACGIGICYHFTRFSWVLIALIPFNSTGHSLVSVEACCCFCY